MTRETYILRTNDLTVGYPSASDRNSVEILRGIKLSIPEGKLICIMGPNGVGKSTLIRTLAGLQDPLDGQIIVDGLNIQEISGNRLAQKISVVLTDRVYPGNLNVYQLVALGRYPFTNWVMQLTDADVEAIEEAIKMTGLSGFEKRKMHELSDGQVQKSMIARALSQEGSITILDEPTAHLDLNNRVEIMRLLKKMAHKENKTILMATHELDLTLQLADLLLLILPDGRIVEGLPEDLVLNGQLDRAFQMKGFDLKTGKTTFVAKPGKTVYIFGDGYHLLWTKNAIERHGHEIVTSIDKADCIVKISFDKDETEWIVNLGDKEVISSSLKEVLQLLDSSWD